MSKQELSKQIIEKAWSDEAFKAKLLADPKEALKEAFNLTIPTDVELIVVEETSTKLALVIPQHPSDDAKTVEPVGDTW
ncbi:NHLP leader peptide family RiPP precursor [Paenibacillus glycinis]|uniref:NHLP leader peptide family natural product n=1 Tax=Paenibacillus glycinis TaxID=2697035 RepID=A0ABW9XKN7_9BACL|nr:NHLP leader peptide family RiPP precursor [Paenibacillus glycinis]NBD23121.1 NHLP leader peptide family natural product precursor [Paenibacillus glycinis]